MKTLIITAHPSENSFTKAIADKFKNSSKNAEIIDLYDREYTQDFLRYDDIEKIEDEPKRDIIQKKITEADILVFVHPIFWGAPPAIMKNFCDQNFTANYAFKYTKGKSMPEGLLKDKTAYVFMTCDAPAFVYNYIFRMPRLFWGGMGLGILPFCGIKVGSVKIFGQMRKSSIESRENWLDQVAKIAKMDK